jgi:hypothetical protein
MHGHDANIAVQVIDDHCDCLDVLLRNCKVLFIFIFNTQGGAESLDARSNILFCGEEPRSRCYEKRSLEAYCATL